MTASAPVRLIVCGERLRGDDGAAPAALERISAGRLAHVDVRVVGGLDAADLIDLEASQWCVVADAVNGVASGELVELSLEQLCEGRAVGAQSTHTLPPSDVMRLVASINGNAPKGRFVGLGGTDFDLGDGLSPRAVRSRLDAFASAVAAAIDEAEPA